MENAINNNNITLAGVVEREPEYSHEVLGEGFYVFMLKCSRTSGNKDTLPVMISDRLVDIREIKVGQVVTVSGQIRSFNRHIDDVKSKLIYLYLQENLKYWHRTQQNYHSRKILIQLYLTPISANHLYTDVLQRAERLQISWWQ